MSGFLEHSPRFRCECLFFFLLFFFLSGQALEADQGALQAKVNATARANVADRTRSNYANSNVRFIQWLSANRGWSFEPCLGRTGGAKSWSGGSCRWRLTKEFKRAMKECLENYVDDIPPLALGRLKTEMYLRWIVSLTSEYDAANSHRSAVRYLFSCHSTALPPNWDAEVTKVFSDSSVSRPKSVLLVSLGRNRKESVTWSFPCTLLLLVVFGRVA